MSALALVQEVAVAAHAPRFVYLHWPFSHALDEPGHVVQQCTVRHDMLAMATVAPRPGFVIALPYRWRRETYSSVGDWKMPSPAVVSALSALNETRHGHIHTAVPGLALARLTPCETPCLDFASKQQWCDRALGVSLCLRCQQPNRWPMPRDLLGSF